MKSSNIKTAKRDRRRKRIRAKISGTLTLPRLSVFRSNKFIYAQLIDDEKSKTLMSASDHSVKGKTKMERAKKTGTTLAEEAKKKHITKVVFDRGGFSYAGRVRALAEGAREGGLVF
ncbi:MAG: 50S ribosomal protein L18 [bacterium]|nr:50S ribosomal protein L18 [bacterium]